ncbi:MAG TPA: hypothetical protein VGS21_04160 [Acidimicrobiales bacterium]|nr:hypothetical protein [Acidimicrobiales bacterium]
MKSRALTSRAAVAAMATAALTLAACGSSTSGSTGNNGPSLDRSAFNAVTGAAAAMKKLHSYDMTAHITMTGVSGPSASTILGMLDGLTINGASNGSLVAANETFGGALNGAGIQIIMDLRHFTIYENLSSLMAAMGESSHLPGGKPWIAVSLGSSSSNFSVPSAASFTGMSALASSVTYEGSQVVNGISTTKYGIYVSQSKIAANFKQIFGSIGLGSVLGKTGLTVADLLKIFPDGEHSVDYVSADDHIVRSEITLPLGQMMALMKTAGASGLGNAVMDETVDFSNFDGPVSLGVPPASEVYTLPLSALGSGGLGSTLIGG